MVRNILDGTTIPARATADGEGNNIPDTYAKKGGKIIPVGIYPPSSTGRTLVLGTYDGEVNVGDVALIMQLSGTTDWGSYQIGDLYEITAVNSNAVTLASSAIGNIFRFGILGKMLFLGFLIRPIIRDHTVHSMGNIPGTLQTV